MASLSETDRVIGRNIVRLAEAKWPDEADYQRGEHLGIDASTYSRLTGKGKALPIARVEAIAKELGVTFLVLATPFNDAGAESDDISFKETFGNVTNTASTKKAGVHGRRPVPLTGSEQSESLTRALLRSIHKLNANFGLIIEVALDGREAEAVETLGRLLRRSSGQLRGRAPKKNRKP